jgi:hypothetical protein
MGDLDLIRELPYRPALKGAQQAGQMAASDRASELQIRLALKGASTDGERTCEGQENILNINH